jgi:SAM-dependent methyltransferase
MKTERADWYDTPLYYDIVFDADTVKEADFLEAVMARYGSARTEPPYHILEPACGSGRLVAEMAKRGHDVSGFDLNENMLRHARERIEGTKCAASLWQDRLEDFRVPVWRTFDLAHCLVSTFKYVTEESGAVSHLRHVADSLCKGGLYVLGLHLTDYDRTGFEHERWDVSRDGVRVICNTRTWPADRTRRTEALRTRLRITREGQTWMQETRWEFRTYDPAQLRRLLKKVPELELVGCHDFNHQIASERKLDDSFADVVLVLRRK